MLFDRWQTKMLHKCFLNFPREFNKETIHFLHQYFFWGTRKQGQCGAIAIPRDIKPRIWQKIYPSVYGSESGLDISRDSVLEKRPRRSPRLARLLCAETRRFSSCPRHEKPINVTLTHVRVSRLPHDMRCRCILCTYSRTCKPPVSAVCWRRTQWEHRARSSP